MLNSEKHFRNGFEVFNWVSGLAPEYSRNTQLLLSPSYFYFSDHENEDK